MPAAALPALEPRQEIHVPPSGATAHAEATCRNCEVPLAGTYCSQCGQKVVHLQVSLHEFVHEATHELLHLDGKIVRTLKRLLFSPGALTNEFMAGRRARYVGPIRLYLTGSLLFFTIATFVDAYGDRQRPAPASPAAVAPQQAPRPEGAVPPERRRSAKTVNPRKNREQRQAELFAALPKAMFVSVPFCAWLIRGAYRSQMPFYVPHLYFAIHVHAAGFFILAAARLVNLGARSMGFSVGFTTLTAFSFDLAMVFSSLLALHRVYGGRRATNLAFGFFLMLVYLGVLLLVLAVVAGSQSRARI